MTPLPPGEELLRVEKLNRKAVLHDISFTLRAGEIVGMAGLIGAGRTQATNPTGMGVRKGMVSCNSPFQ